MKRELRSITNCPNCGAPISGPLCEYCGTIFSSQEKPKQMTLPSELEYLLHYKQTQMLQATLEVSQHYQTQMILQSLNIL